MTLKNRLVNPRLNSPETRREGRSRGCVRSSSSRVHFCQLWEEDSLSGQDVVEAGGGRGAGQKQQSKKEKMKERRERWLSSESSISSVHTINNQLIW
ncbi:uncharacterized [Tachysurus ichikawai]